MDTLLGKNNLAALDDRRQRSIQRDRTAVPPLQTAPLNSRAHETRRRNSRCRSGQANEIRPAQGPSAARRAPLLGHVVSRARALDPASMHVVYGHGGDAVRAAFANENLTWALQAEQLGTGHAVMQAMPKVADDELVLVLYGDVPLIRTTRCARSSLPPGPKGHEPAHGDARQPHRLRSHRAQCARRNPENRRAEGRDEGAAQDPRRQQRHHGRARQTTAQVAGQDQERQRAGRVLPDRHHRDGGEGQGQGHAADLADRSRNARRQRQGAARRARGAAPRRARARAHARGRDAADPARIDMRGEVNVGRDVFIDANVLLEGAWGSAIGCVSARTSCCAT